MQERPPSGGTPEPQPTEHESRFEIELLKGFTRRMVKLKGRFSETLLLTDTDWINREDRADGIIPFLTMTGVNTRDDVYAAIQELQRACPMYNTQVVEDRVAGTITYEVSLKAGETLPPVTDRFDMFLERVDSGEAFD